MQDDPPDCRLGRRVSAYGALRRYCDLHLFFKCFSAGQNVIPSDCSNTSTCQMQVRTPRLRCIKIPPDRMTCIIACKTYASGTTQLPLMARGLAGRTDGQGCDSCKYAHGIPRLHVSESQLHSSKRAYTQSLNGRGSMVQMRAAHLTQRKPTRSKQFEKGDVILEVPCAPATASSVCSLLDPVRRPCVIWRAGGRRDGHQGQHHRPADRPRHSRVDGDHQIQARERRDVLHSDPCMHNRAGGQKVHV